MQRRVLCAATEKSNYFLVSVAERMASASNYLRTRQTHPQTHWSRLAVSRTVPEPTAATKSSKTGFLCFHRPCRGVHRMARAATEIVVYFLIFGSRRCDRCTNQLRIHGLPSEEASWYLGNPWASEKKNGNYTTFCFRSRDLRNEPWKRKNSKEQCICDGFCATRAASHQKSGS